MKGSIFPGIFYTLIVIGLLAALGMLIYNLGIAVAYSLLWLF